MKITIRQLPEFRKWLHNLKDGVVHRRLARQLERVEHGNFGDIKPVGEGVFEMREHFGCGWRMYYVQRGDVVVIMLGGGDKTSQQTDIANAQRLASMLED